MEETTNEADDTATQTEDLRLERPASAVPELDRFMKSYRATLAALTEWLEQTPALPPRVTVPRMPLLVLEEPEPINPQHCVVAVRSVPILGETTSIRVYSDPKGLTWETYGKERDFTDDRMLEIHDSDGVVIATHQAGMWLHVDYIAHVETP